jgi:hypothetical protein
MTGSTIDNGSLKLKFGEQGARRSSTGTFDLVLEDLEVLRGSFSSSAALRQFLDSVT